MRRSWFLALWALSCAPQQAASRFKGVELSACPPRVDGAALSSIAEDVSPDLAEERARVAFSEDHGLPDHLKSIAPIRSLAGCQDDGGTFFVAVGFTNKDLDKLAPKVQPPDSSRTLQAAIGQSARVRSWNQLCTFLHDHGTQCQLLDEAPFKRNIAQRGGTIGVETALDVPSSVKDAIVQALLETGVRLNQNEPAGLVVNARIDVETLPVTDDQRRFVRSRATFALKDGPNLVAERTWEAKGGGLTSEQAASVANKDLATKIRAELVSALFGEVAP